MKKQAFTRFLSVILAACMLITLLPPVILTVSAEGTEASGKTVSVSFKTEDGKLIRRTDVSAGYVYLYAPTEAELLAVGMTAEEIGDILGWYYTAPDGKVYDIGAFASVRLERDIVFVPYTKTLTLDISKGIGAPLYDSKTGDLIAWQNGYTVGYVKASEPLGTYTPYDGVAIATEDILRAAYEWDEGGVYLRSHVNDGFILPSASKGKTTAISFTAYVGGSVALTLDMGSDAVYLLIAKNGSVVYPAGASASDTSTWYKKAEGTGEALVAFENLTVAAGDEIRIVMARADDSSLATPTVAPTVTYTSVATDKWNEIVTGITTNMKDNQPTVSNKVVTNRGNWSYIYYPDRNSLTLDQAVVLDAYMTIGGSSTVTIPAHAGETSGGKASISVYRGTNASWDANKSGEYAMALLNGRVGGYRYTAELDGTVDIDFTKLGRFCKTDSIYSTTDSNFFFAIYVDGVKVWPVSTSAENSAIDSYGWYGMGGEAKQTQKDITAAANAVDVSARRSIEVKKGSVVDILAVNAYGDVYMGNGLLLFTDISYTSTAKQEVSNIADHMPTVSNNKVQFKDKWSLVYYPSVSDITEEKREPVDSIMTIGGDKTYTIAANAGITAAGSTSIGFYTGTNAYWDADGMGLLLCCSVVAGYCYTAESTGLVNLDFTKLGRFASGGSDGSEISFAVYVDGVKIWPSSTSAENENINQNGWYKMLSQSGTTDLTDAANALDLAARRNIFVQAGSRIEILATATTNSIYSCTGLLMKTDVSFTEYDPELSVYATLGGALSLNIQVGKQGLYNNYKVEVNGKTLTPDHGIFTYADIAAKDIHTQIPYRVTADLSGLRNGCVLAEGEISVASYMKTLAEDKTLSDEIRSLAQAYIGYGEAAEKYFANGTLNTAEKELIKNPPNAEGEAVMQDTCEAPTFGFRSATLLLNDEIDLKLFIDAKTALTSFDEYTVRVTAKDGTVRSEGWKLVQRSGDEDMRYFKTIITGIPVSTYADELYITVMQGDTPVSDTLVYSVYAYVSRMYEEGSDLAKNLLHQIVALGDAASGENLVCLWGAWEMVTAPDFATGKAGTEKRVCELCGKEQIRDMEAVSMTYQEIYGFGAPALSVLNETVTSTVTGSNTPDEHVLTVRADGKVFATGCGTAVVVTADGNYAVTVGAATINMLFLAGQSNADGAHATTDPVNSADYAKYFIRSPEAMAYITHAGGSLDVTAAETSGAHPKSFVVTSLKWGDQTRYGTAVSGPASTALCTPSSNYSTPGITAGLAYEWVKQTGERVWIINASQGSQSIQTFVPTDSTGTANVPELAYSNYEQAIAVYRLALQTMENEVAAGHFTLNHMGFYWLQGESDSTCDDFYYEEQFERLFTGLQKDVVYGEGSEKKAIEFAAILPVRSCKDNSGNSLAEMYMTGSRLAQYKMGADGEGVNHNVYLITNATESWLESDENVVNYLLARYGSAENFKAIFGYDMPTTRAMMHPDIHYAIYGYNEMGIDAARNTLMILAAQGEDYKLSYPELTQNTTIRLVERDGYTTLTSILFDVDSNIGYIIPRIEPLYRMAEGVRFVSETEGFDFDGFCLSYNGEELPDEIIFSVYLGETWLQRYQMPILAASTYQISADRVHVEDGTGTRQYLYPSRSDVWQNGWVDYATGEFHLFTQTAPSGWRLDENDTLWTNPFHGAELRSHGIALGNVSGTSSGAISYTAQRDGYITPYFEYFYAGTADSRLAILANGRLVWPQNANTLNYEDTANWIHIKGGDGADCTTAEDINAALNGLTLKVEAGDEIVFVFEYVNGSAMLQAMPMFFFTEAKNDAIVVPQTPYEGPIDFASITSSFDLLNNSTPWDVGYLTYATETFTPYTTYSGGGWMYDGNNLWDNNTTHGAFLKGSFATSPSKPAGHDIAIRYTVQKAGRISLHVSRIVTTSQGDSDLAIFVKRNGTCTPVWPTGAAVVNGNPSGWYRLYNGKNDGENPAATQEAVNAAMQGLVLDVQPGDEIFYVFGYVDSNTAQSICYPLIVYQ